MHKLIISSENNSIDLYNDEDIFLINSDGFGLACNINISEYGMVDGAFYNSSHIGARHISLNVRFKGDVAMGKKRLFSVIKPHKEVKIRIVTDTVNAVISGYAESLNIPPNNQKPVGSISIICPYPFFTEGNTRSEILYGHGGGFKFSQGGQNFRGVRFGTAKTSQTTLIDIDSHIASGGVFVFKFKNTLPSITVRNITSGKYFTFTYDFQPGDILTVNTVTGSKAAVLMRGAEEIDLLYAMTGNFIQLEQGENELHISSDNIAVEAVSAAVDYDILIAGI